MNTVLSTVPESCTRCPYLDHFHSTCSHPLRQSLIQEFADEHDDCPVFSEVRAEAMRDLETDLR